MNKRESIVLLIGTLLIVGFMSLVFYNSTNPKTKEFPKNPVVVDSTVFDRFDDLSKNDSIIIEKLDNVRTIRVFKVKKIQKDTVTLQTPR